GPCHTAPIGSLAQEGQMSICLRRREFVAGLGGAAAWPLAARAQQRMPVIGFLSTASAEEYAPVVLPGFRRGLNELGYVEGRNVVVDYRWSNGNSFVPGLAAELIAKAVNVIVTSNNGATVVTKRLTTTIPIVFATGSDRARLRCEAQPPRWQC